MVPWVRDGTSLLLPDSLDEMPQNLMLSNTERILTFELHFNIVISCKNNNVRAQKLFTLVLLCLVQQDFKKDIGINTIHYLHSIDLCWSSTEVNCDFNSDNAPAHLNLNFPFLFLEMYFCARKSA